MIIFLYEDTLKQEKKYIAEQINKDLEGDGINSEDFTGSIILDFIGYEERFILT
jgi:hypothetical protein